MFDPEVLTVRFWGVRGSYPTPGKATERYGGNTACISIHFHSYTLILDAGTGIIQLGRELVRQTRAGGAAPAPVLLFTHYHHDHTQGFPFFAPTRLPEARIAVFGPQLHRAGPRKVLSRVMSMPMFPLQLDDLPARLRFETVGSEHVLLVGDEAGGVRRLNAGDPLPAGDPRTAWVRIYQSPEHPDGVLHYRVEWCGRSIVYATDREGPMSADHPLVAFARRADLLIHDAQYTEEHYLGQQPERQSTRGFGHSTVAMACEVARLAEVRQLALFHLDPDYSDDQMGRILTRAQALFPGTISAAEGLSLTYRPCLTPAQAAGDPTTPCLA